MPPLLGSCPEMRVYREDTRKGGVVGRGRPKWVEPCDMDSDEKGF